MVVALVVAVQRVGGVRDHGVGLDRSTSRWVDGGAIRAVAARVVQRRLQRRVIPGGGVRHAPALHVEVELVHLGHVRVKQAEVLLDIVWSASLHVPVDCSIA
jgi:hypothetical protein